MKRIQPFDPERTQGNDTELTLKMIDEEENPKKSK